MRCHSSNSSINSWVIALEATYKVAAASIWWPKAFNKANYMLETSTSKPTEAPFEGLRLDFLDPLHLRLVQVLAIDLVHVVHLSTAVDWPLETPTIRLNYIELASKAHKT